MHTKTLNKVWIGRCISLLLILAFCGLIIWAVMYIREADEIRARNQNAGASTSPIAVDRKKKYGESGFQKVAENELLILCADFSSGEISVEQKSTGKVWYSNPIDRNEPGIQGVKNRLSSQILYTSVNVKTERTTTYDSFSQSLRQGGMSHEMIDNGVRFRFAFPTTGIIIPIEYVLDGDALRVSVPMDELQELWSEEFVTLSIDVLPFFGVSGLEDEGYMFIPDGSGALIELNSDKYTYMQYTGAFYERDSVLDSSRNNSLREQITMPVFGMKTNDAAFLGVVTEGAETGKLYSYLSRKATSYNQVYTQTTLRAFSKWGVSLSGTNNINTSEESANAIDITDNLLSGRAYTVKYFFLEKEDADYSGMSRRYRKYLADKNRLNNSELAKAPYLILDVYGAVPITQVVMGISRDVITDLTTYNQACEIVRTLKERGVENILLNYVGGLRGGVEGKLYDTAQIEPALGTQQDFDDMLAYFEQENVQVFFETNPMLFYEAGNGYSRRSHAVKSFFDNYAWNVPYSSAGRVLEISRRGSNFVSPRYVPSFVEKFAASAASMGIRNISVDGLGNMLYSDLNKDERYVLRPEVRDLWLEAGRKALDSSDYLMVHGGNMFIASVADVITDTAANASEFDVEEYGVPFYQMTLNGSVLLGTKPINQNADYHKAFLQAMETGESIKFNVMHASPTKLVKTQYSRMVSFGWENWVDTIVEDYRRMMAVLGPVAGERIVNHTRIADGVTQTVYESGRSVLVNYNDTEYLYGDKSLAARDCILLDVKEGE